MYNEHFGISVVENIAGGLVMLANNSGGPMMDIIDHGVSGYLASTAEEYADIMYRIVRSKREDLDRIRSAGRKAMKKFSDEQFQMTLDEVVKKSDILRPF